MQASGGLEVANGGDDFSKEPTTDGHLCQLKGDLTGVAHDPGPDLYEAALDAGQGPVGDLLWEIYALEEDAEIVGQFT